MKLWVVTGESESSDHYGPLVFSKKPSEERLKKLYLIGMVMMRKKGREIMGHMFI